MPLKLTSIFKLVAELYEDNAKNMRSQAILLDPASQVCGGRLYEWTIFEMVVANVLSISPFRKKNICKLLPDFASLHSKHPHIYNAQ